MRANLVSRIAAFGLVAVFAITGTFTLWNIHVNDVNGSNVVEANTMSRHYTTVRYEVVKAELLLNLRRVNGDPAYLSQQQHAEEAIAASMLVIAASDRPADREFAVWSNKYFTEIAAIFARLEEVPPPPFEEVLVTYRAMYREMYDSIAAGDIGDTTLIDQLDNPLLTDNLRNPIPVVMSFKAAESQQLADDARTAEVEAAAYYRVTAPFLYGTAIILVVILLAITLRFGRREERAIVENDHLRRLTTTDTLTQLGNRRAFEEATKRLAQSPAGGDVSLIMIDVDEFKMVNDTYGHARGDAVLANFGELLREMAPPGTGRFRIGGDEFALIVHGLDGPASLLLADNVRLAASGILGNGVTVSAGVALLNPNDRDEAVLRQQADAALYEGKLRGRNMAVLYRGGDHAAPVFAAARLEAVRLLLVEGRIDAVFQPIWDLGTQSLLGYEGLSRPHEDYGLNGPQEAFDIAEQFGHAADLDRLCRNHLLAAASELPADARIFINLSPYSLTHQSFSPFALLRELEVAGVSKSRIVFEVTEKSSVSMEAISEAVAGLRALGIAIALDDVGAGNNGLAMLRTVPCDYIKIDRAVILTAAAGGSGRAALMAILAFAAETGACVVAEGIEDVPMFELVRDVATQTSLRGKPGLIHGVQGYLFGMPLPAAQTARNVPKELGTKKAAA